MIFHLVAQSVGVFSGGEEGWAFPDVDAVVFDAVGFLNPVTQHLKNLKINIGMQLTVDAPLDADLAGNHGDCFGHGQGSVFLHLDHAVEGKDALPVGQFLRLDETRNHHSQDENDSDCRVLHRPPVSFGLATDCSASYHPVRGESSLGHSCFPATSVGSGSPLRSARNDRRKFVIDNQSTADILSLKSSCLSRGRGLG